MKNIYSFLIAFGSVLTASAQSAPVDTTKKILDGYFRNTNIENRKVVAYPYVRQEDIVYKKRIWREIDVREKINHLFAAPNAKLMDILVEAIQEGKLIAYDPMPTAKNPSGDNFEFMAELPVDQVMSRLGGDSVLVEEFNENNEVIGSHYEKRAFNGGNVLKFRIKEDWIFDKQRSVFEPRIVGIAPLISPIIPEINSSESSIYNTGSSTGNDPFAPKENTNKTVAESSVTGRNSDLNDVSNMISQVDPTPAFWIYFPDARHVLVNKEIVNRNNAGTGLTYDDIFVKRMFSSYIVKQDNLEDLRIKDYISDEMGRLYESERIKKQLSDWEQDLWSY